MARRSKPGVESGRPGNDRFEATVHPGEQNTALSETFDLDLDRIPDPQGGVRVVVTAEEIAELLDRGYEVRLYRTVPLQPLDPGLVATEEDAERWLENRVSGITREGES